MMMYCLDVLFEVVEVRKEVLGSFSLLPPRSVVFFDWAHASYS